MSIIRRAGYNDRFRREDKRYALAYPNENRFAQSSEMNELQSMQDDHRRRIADYILQDGRKMKGADPIVEAVPADPTKFTLRLPLAEIYIGGFAHEVAEAFYTLPVVGDIIVGVRRKEKLETSVTNPELRGDIPGTEAFSEPGADRVRFDVTWGHSQDGSTDPLIPVYTIRDGAILTNETNIDFSAIFRTVEDYSDESNGPFVNTGCMVSALGLNASNEQQYTISEGVAYVGGRRIPRLQNMRFTVKEEPDLRQVAAEPHAWTAVTGGSQTFTLSKEPIESVQRVTIVKRVTETVTHGAFNGAVDALAHSSVESIISVKQGGNTYANPASWSLVQGQLDWSAGGPEPAPGSAYQVDYRYYEQVQPTARTRTTITVEGAVNPSNILVDYTFKLPRVDVIAMDKSGAVLYLKGVSATTRPQAPEVPANQLELAQVVNKWGMPPEVIQSAVRNVPYSRIINMEECILDLYDLVAQERLKSNIAANEVSAKRGVFVDNFMDDDMRDQGIAQTAAVFGGACRLPVAARIHEFPAITQVQMLDYTDEVVISQLRETGEMKINPYATFTPMPGTAALEPSVDIWTEKENVWPSATTAKFDPPNFGANGNNNTITSVSLEAKVEKIRTSTKAAEFIRPRDINFRLEGFIEAETLKKVMFDGVQVVISGAGPANDEGVIAGVLTIPAGIPQGTKVVSFEGSVGTTAASSYVGNGTITVEEFRLATALNGEVEELPQPVVNVTNVTNNTNINVINQTTVVNQVTNINQVTNTTRPVSESTSRGNGSAGGRSDPLAMTFSLIEGRCLSGIRLKCKTKGSSANTIVVQIRTVATGLPTEIILASATVLGRDIKAGEMFTAKFAVPVYLEPGRQYAFVALTDDNDHSLAIAQLGKIDQNNTIVSEQPFVVGVLLSSSNSLTWTVHNDADLVFEILACKFNPVEKTVPLGVFTPTKMSDIIMLAGVEYPDAEALIQFELKRLNGETLTLVADQRMRLEDFISNEQIQVNAKLKGTKRVTPFLFPGTQIVEGEISLTADYVTRLVQADGADRASVTFDANLPAGSTVKVEIGVPGDWVEATVFKATPLGNGVVEQVYQRKPYAPLDARARITFNGNPRSRPEIKSLRMVTTEI